MKLYNEKRKEGGARIGAMPHLGKKHTLIWTLRPSKEREAYASITLSRLGRKYASIRIVWKKRREKRERKRWAYLDSDIEKKGKTRSRTCLV